MTAREGVDLSSWNGTPGQWASEAGDYGWAAVKITELGPGGTRYVNPTAAADWAYLRDKGKHRIAYLFGHPSTSAADSATFFIAQVRALGLGDADAVALDLETSDGLSPAEVNDWASAVLSVLEADLHRRPLLYTYLAFAEEGNCASLGSHPLWIADPSSKPGHPRVPAPWKWWSLHQYSITPPLDRDVMHYPDLAAMREHLGRREPRHRAKPVKPPKHPARKATAATARVVKAEPMLTAGTVNGALAAATVYLAPHVGLHLSRAQDAAVITIVTALAAAAAAAFTRPVRVTALTGAAATIATAAAAFGLKVPSAWLGADVAAASALLPIILRGHVSPASPPALPGPTVPPAGGST